MRSTWATFRGKRWRVEFPKRLGKALGQCESPEAPDKTISLSLATEQRERLSVAVHEALHACAWDLDEQAVEEISSDIAAFLSKLDDCGYL